MKRAEKGITLIALIITIIVMLILVGVTVTSALNGGLFNTAKDVVDKTRSELEKENKIASGEAINKYLPPVADDWSTPATELPIDEDGNYHIKTCAELAKFAEMVNGGNVFEGQTVLLDVNLNLQGNNDKQWTPIGSGSNKFNGIFDGQYHYISGIYIDTDILGNYGLFGYIGNYEDTNIIQNLGIKDSTINAPNGDAGGIVGYNTGIIKNCYNEAEIIGGEKAGGIAAFSDSQILECYNIGTITGYYAGGIAGDNEVEEGVQRCYNTGTIIGATSNSFISGIATTGSVKDCYNTGTLKAADFLTISNISGISDYGVTNCYNIGGIYAREQPSDWSLISTNEGAISNSYCLSELGISFPVGCGKTNAEMKKTQDFVDLLNNGRTGKNAVWKMDTNEINNGYPILYWQ